MEKNFEISGYAEMTSNGLYRPIISFIDIWGDETVLWEGKARFEKFKDALEEAELEFELMTKP